MAVVFDTASIPAQDRADRLRVALAEASVSSVALPDDGTPVNARLEVWPLGGSYLFRAETSAVRMFRTPVQATRDPVPLLALAVQERGAGWHRQYAPRSRIAPGVMMGMDMTESFEFAWSGRGASRALMIPIEQLDVSADLLRHAVPRLAQSPLYALMTAHIVELFDAADTSVDHPAAVDVANSSVDLARATLASLSTKDATRRDVSAHTLAVRIRDHVRRNLRDPELSASSIARAHNISLRHLYGVCAASDVRLEEHIIQRRLAGVHAELSLPAAQWRTIESIARGWGFRNVSHFSRRFKAEFGISPREWRSVSANRHGPEPT